MELPVFQPQPTERADAARNRARILRAAEKLFAEQGVRCTSMDAIAAEAGVGKGTLFRRFGDRASLAMALLDETERALQDAVLSGPPPVGPGAPPCQRLRAFGAALLDHLELNSEILFEAEISSAAGGYLRSQAYRVRWLHMRALVAEARPECDADYVADVLLAPMSAQVFLHQRRERKMSLDLLKRNFADLVDTVMTVPIG